MPAALYRWFGVLLGVGAAGGASTGIALADHQPTFVLPHHRSVPVFVDGVDATGAVIEGDWGLYRAGAGVRTIYPDDVPVTEGALTRAYFPTAGRRPRYGRHEIEPSANRSKPTPAPVYYRRWTSESRSTVVTRDDGWLSDPSEVIEAPRQHWEHHRRPPRRHKWKQPRQR